MKTFVSEDSIFTAQSYPPFIVADLMIYCYKSIYKGAKNMPPSGNPELLGKMDGGSASLPI